MAGLLRAIALCILIAAIGEPAWAQSVNFPSVTVGSSQAGPEVKGLGLQAFRQRPVPRDHPGP